MRGHNPSPATKLSRAALTFRAAHVNFPPPIGERTAYLFPFSDQVFFPRRSAPARRSPASHSNLPGSELCCRCSCG